MKEDIIKNISKLQESFKTYSEQRDLSLLPPSGKEIDIARIGTKLSNKEDMEDWKIKLNLK
jgi:hypothetical protein